MNLPKVIGQKKRIINKGKKKGKETWQQTFRH